MIEDRDEPALLTRQDGAELMVGNAADPKVLEVANLANARRMSIAIAQSFSGATLTILGEREIAQAMLRHAGVAAGRRVD